MPNDANSDEYQRRICRAIDYISAHLADCPSIAEISRAAPFSSFHFQQLFRALTSESVGEFTRRLRLEQAAHRLTYGSGDDITGLAYDLGFSSSQNFAKAFKKHFGVTPTEYRRLALTTRVECEQTPHLRTTFRRTTVSTDLTGDVCIQPLESQRVVYLRHFGSYGSDSVQAAFESLVRWAKSHDLHRNGSYIGIPWDDSDITPDAHCRFDACLVVPPDAIFRGMNTQVVPTGKYATYRTKINNHDFDLPWTELMSGWLPGSGFQPADGPRYEIYHSDGSSDLAGRWEIEICLPIRPMN